MWVERVRINGGFLAGIDVSLKPGLNVIIGPRGAGKTTLLDLIRHGLGSEPANSKGPESETKAIRALLGAGEVVMTMQDRDASLHLVVDAEGHGTNALTQNMSLSLGQNELEQIASSAESRLRLIDLRAALTTASPSLERVAQLTTEIAQLKALILEREETAGRRSILENQRAAARSEEKRLLATGAKTVALQREKLRALENHLLEIGEQAEGIREFNHDVLMAGDHTDALLGAVRRLRNKGRKLFSWTKDEDPLQAVEQQVAFLRENFSGLQTTLIELRGRLSETGDQLRQQAAPLRAELEEAETGLGQVTAQLRNLEQELLQVSRNDAWITDATGRRRSLIAERDQILDEYESWQEDVYQARRELANSLSSDLNSRIVVSIEHLAETTGFEDTLNLSLQNSGVQYRSAVLAIARSILPRQLLELIESGDAHTLALSTGLSSERSNRILAHLSEPRLTSLISTATLQDRVDFLLRDGAEQKSVDSLSTGQKCAVTLPIVLTERSRLLVLDQPEDHLDNAYLVHNVVGALQRREGLGAQTIVATHNANIPVLGAAANVVVLDSDGSHGFVSHYGSFDDPQIVNRITELMEGGKEAFRKRADFYDQYGALRGSD